jgi:hypothetical protein
MILIIKPYEICEVNECPYHHPVRNIKNLSSKNFSMRKECLGATKNRSWEFHCNFEWLEIKREN